MTAKLLPDQCDWAALASVNRCLLEGLESSGGVWIFSAPLERFSGGKGCDAACLSRPPDRLLWGGVWGGVPFGKKAAFPPLRANRPAKLQGGALGPRILEGGRTMLA